MQAAHRSLQAHGWKQWLEQVRATQAAGPSSPELGKLRGPVLSMSRTDLINPRVAEKRAFRRARQRAGRMGGTWYRGQFDSSSVPPRHIFHRYAGLLIMLSKHHFKENRDIRGVVWDAIDHMLASIPLRNILHMRPAATRTAEANADSEYGRGNQQAGPPTDTFSCLSLAGQWTPPDTGAALLQAVHLHDPKVDELQQAVQRELQKADISDLHALHQCINTTLCQVAARLFPTRRSPDARLSAQVGFRASARHTWQLYAQYRRARVATLGHIVQKWRLAVQFFRASRALRDQSQALKRQAFQTKLLQAEQAAAAGDQRTLHQIVNSLAPNHRKVFSRLRGQDGKLLSKPEEAKALVAQGASTYAQYPDLPVKEPLSQHLHIEEAEVVGQLRAIKASKAVPKHIAPAVIWKICASTLGPLLARAFNHHFQEGQMGLLQGDLTDASMVMLPKVGKPAHLLENLRPIGLMAPPSKSLAGILRDRMMEWQLPRLRFRPQFAYTPNRGTFDALLRVHKHVEDAMALFRSNRISRFGQHGGRKPLPFVGALSLSLDLSRAFDLTDRQMLFQALPQYGIPPEVVEVARRLHYGAKFIYKAGDCEADFTPTNGLKQGCKVAPCLWVWYTIILMDSLAGQLNDRWVEEVLTLFADDCWASWLLHSKDDLHRALTELRILLCTLESFRMKINYSKTAVLLKFVGRQARQALHDITKLQNGIRYLCLDVQGVERLIPLKEEHEYLGSRVSYHRQQEVNVTHRLQASQARYQALRKALTGRHAIQQGHRLRLWRACISTSMLYSLPAVGLNEPGLRRLEVRVLQHLRAILRLPAHLTMVENAEIWSRSQIQPPGTCVLQAMLSACGKLEDKARRAPDITTRPELMDHLRHLIKQLHLLLEGRDTARAKPTPEADQTSFSCPHCSHVSSSDHALRIHVGLHHPEQQKSCVGQAVTFSPELHAIGVPPTMTLSSDSSQGLNPEADIFRHCLAAAPFPTGAKQDPPNKRRRPSPHQQPQRGYRRFPRRGSSDPEESELVLALARLALRQETQLAELRMDKGFVMFFKQDQISILPGLYAVSKEFNAKQAEGHPELTTPLRTLLLACLMRQFRERVVHMMGSPEGIHKLQTAGWLTTDQVWTRQKWCRQTKRLVPDQEGQGIPHADLLSSIDFLLVNLKGDIIHQFHSTTKLKTLEGENAQVATFLMSISLRGQRAYEVHLHFLNLIGASALQLIGLSLKRETLQRSQAARHLESLLYKR
ncbi:unnamed protein product [Symbiodinium necroappetens]|uniref:Reverse transcriptase domain-containing protein n=1 Tax=Symbiodinium necroappetens TaxID=1628268 RepID=A0A812VGY8_9DINO|nr:unnamed protein product [Symbiodinium necroappetens]